MLLFKATTVAAMLTEVTAINVTCGREGRALAITSRLQSKSKLLSGSAELRVVERIGHAIRMPQPL